MEDKDIIVHITEDFNFDDFYSYIERSVQKGEYTEYDNLYDYLIILFKDYVDEYYGFDMDQEPEDENDSPYLYTLAGNLEIENYNHYHYLLLLVLSYSRDYHEEYWKELLDKNFEF